MSCCADCQHFLLSEEDYFDGRLFLPAASFGTCLDGWIYSREQGKLTRTRPSTYPNEEACPSFLAIQKQEGDA